MDSSSVKNITVALLVITFLFVGYYIYSQRDSNSINPGANEALFENVQKYIARREVLNQITLDTALFSNPRFTSLSGLPRGLQAQPVSRSNPFDEVSFTQTSFRQ